MKWIVMFFFASIIARAETSKLVPYFLEAGQMYVNGELLDNSLYASPQVRAVLKVLEERKVSQKIIQKYLKQNFVLWNLRPDDEYDRWVSNPQPKKRKNIPEISLHALKIDVFKTTDDFFKDDIYGYFFITDGVVPTGKVTSVYKGLSAKQGFFFNEMDRSIFPLVAGQTKSPENHLIVDYGIIESDGDDIKEMQKLSTIIIDIAIAVYSSYDPQRSKVLINLRKEVQALAEMLLNLNHDDRMATGTFAIKAAELGEMLKDKTFIEITRSHQGEDYFNKWRYDLTFRILRK